MVKYETVQYLDLILMATVYFFREFKVDLIQIFAKMIMRSHP